MRLQCLPLRVKEQEATSIGASDSHVIKHGMAEVQVLDLHDALRRHEDVPSAMTINQLALKRQAISAPSITQKFLSEEDFTAAAPMLQNRLFRSVEFGTEFRNESKENRRITMAIPSLSPARSLEVWIADENVESQPRRGIMLKKCQGLMLQTLYAREDGSRDDLRATALKLYRQFFALLKTYPDQKPLRLWNYIPNIVAKEESCERYHLFNIGRYEAWQAYGPKDINGQPIYPAATGIGSHGGPVVLEGLTTSYPVYYLQNPRQIPAPHYSKKYGVLPPVFSRATLHLPPGGPELFIAGTASITGEDATWLNDPAMQARETLKNIEVLMGSENLSSIGQDGYDFDDLSNVRVYIKHPEHLPIIRREVESVIDPDAIIYLHDDICRREWLLEIEGVARRDP